MMVVVSGYFDPFHVGHLELFKKAWELGDKLVVIVNNDHQARLKKGKSFMNEKDRLEIIRAIGIVDHAMLSIDTDLSVCKTLETVRPDIFANGGDRDLSNSPERETCERLKIKMVNNLGEKIRSSSELVKNG